METSVSSGKKVVVNSIIMYVQLILNVLIGLVSVRILLNALGQSDYGLYDLIAGIIGLFSFITASLSQSSMRYISVSLGAGDNEKTKSVVSSCVWLHIFISLALCFILEVAGVFLFDGFLNISQERIGIAKIIYHCMVLSLFFNINIAPLNALVSSFENFLFISLVTIFDSLLKLGIAFWVMYTSFDKLLLYGVMIAGITILNYLIYLTISVTKYRSAYHVSKPDYNGIRSVVGFASWTLLDTFSSVINRQGYAVMLNKFFGTTMNSSFAISRQLEGQVFSVSSVVVNAMKPQIMKSFGKGETDRMFRLSLTAGKFGFYLMSMVCIPLLVMMPDVLQLWLGFIPDNTVLFGRLLIIACMMEQLTRGLVYANQAIGNIKWFSIIVSTLRILALPVSIFALLLGAEAWVAIFIFLVFETLGSLSRIIVLSRISDFKPVTFFKSVLKDVTIPTLCTSLFCCFIYPMGSGILWMIACILVTILLLVIAVFFTGLTIEERSFIRGVLQKIMKRF